MEFAAQIKGLMLPINLNMYTKFSTLQKAGVGIKQSVEWLDNRQDEPGFDPAALKVFFPSTKRPKSA
jgi:hypothetical protein